MRDTYTVTTYENGTATTVEHQASPKMQEIFARADAFSAAHPDFWCHCGKPETGRITPRGHSVDVDCANCGGCLQVG